MDLRQYLDIIRRHRWTILLPAFVVAALMGILAAAETPVYEATARVLLRPFDPGEQLDPRDTPSPVINDPDRYISSQQEIIRSEAVAARAANALRASHPSISSSQVRAAVSVSSSGGNEVIDVSARSVDPEEARDIAASVVQAYVESRREVAVAGLSRAVEDIEGRLGQLQARIAELDRSVAADPASESVKAARNAAVTQYESLFGRQQELLVNVSLKRGEAELIAEATTPTAPVSPRPVWDSILGFLVGLFLGLAIAFLREQLDDRVHSGAEIERLAGLSVLAVFPFDHATSRHPDKVAALERPTGELTEAARSLRTSIQLLGMDEPIRSIVVTSPGPCEGRSVVAANLAVVYAKAGYRTLLVSADLRSPRLDRMFAGIGLGDSPGLTGLLAARAAKIGKSALEAGVVHTRAIPGASFINLALLPSGPAVSNPAELLGSRSMSVVLGDLTREADIVVFDTPPMLSFTDAVVLAAKCDSVVLVTALGHTRRGDIRRATSILSGSRARVLGAVVREANATRRQDRHGANGGTRRKRRLLSTNEVVVRGLQPDLSPPEARPVNPEQPAPKEKLVEVAAQPVRQQRFRRPSGR